MLLVIHKFAVLELVHHNRISKLSREKKITKCGQKANIYEVFQSLTPQGP